MPKLKGTKTEDNLKAAFAGESQANRRYLYFAQKADIEGHNDVAVVFRSTAEGETGHAHGHLEFLEAEREAGRRVARLLEELEMAMRMAISSSSRSRATRRRACRSARPRTT